MKLLNFCQLKEPVFQLMFDPFEVHEMSTTSHGHIHSKDFWQTEAC